MPQTHHPCSNLTLLILLTHLIWLIESYIKGKFKILSPEGTIEYAHKSFSRGNHRVCSKFFLPREPQSTLTILSPEGTIEYAHNSFSRGNHRVRSEFFLPREQKREKHSVCEYDQVFQSSLTARFLVCHVMNIAGILFILMLSKNAQL